MTTNNFIPFQTELKTKKKNIIFGLLALFLISMNALKLHSLLMSLKEDNNIIDKLWEPSGDVLFLTVPTFTFICIIIVWLITPKPSQMNFFFKVVTIISCVLYIIYALFIVYIFALGNGMGH